MIKPDIKKISVVVTALFLMTTIGCGVAGDQTTKAKKSFTNPPTGVTIYRSRQEGKEARTVRYLLHKTAKKCIIANTYMRAVSKFKPGKNGSIAEFNELMRYTRAAYADAQRAAIVTRYYSIGLIQLEKQKKGFSPYALESLNQEPFAFSGIAYAASDVELQKVFDNAKVGHKLDALAKAMGTTPNEAKKFLDSQPAKYEKVADINNALHKAQAFTNAGLKVVGVVGTAAAVATAAPTAGVGLALAGGVALTAGIVDTGVSIGNAVDVAFNDGRASESTEKVMFVTGAVNTVAGGTFNVTKGVGEGKKLTEAVLSCFKDDKDTIINGRNAVLGMEPIKKAEDTTKKVVEAARNIYVSNKPATALEKASERLKYVVNGLNTASWYSDRTIESMSLMGVSEINYDKTNEFAASFFYTNNTSGNRERMSYMGFTQKDIDNIYKEAEKRRAAENKKTWRDLYKEAKALGKQDAQNNSVFNNFVNGNYGDMVRDFGGHPNDYIKKLEKLLMLINVNNTTINNTNNNANVKTKHIITLTPKPGGAPAKPKVVSKPNPQPSQPKPAPAKPKAKPAKKVYRHVSGTY